MDQGGKCAGGPDGKAVVNGHGASLNFCDADQVGAYARIADGSELASDSLGEPDRAERVEIDVDHGKRVSQIHEARGVREHSRARGARA